MHCLYSDFHGHKSALKCKGIAHLS
uniref:Uncharacterized protein n=1 Tax=Anguilla anguilla TaxID=7936 RepID=A0A0E9VDB2_ANGAN